MDFNTTKITQLDEVTFELPDDADNLIQILYADGTVMPPNLYTFLPTRLIKLSCPLPKTFGCLMATWTPYQGKCCVKKKPCECN